MNTTSNNYSSVPYKINGSRKPVAPTIFSLWLALVLAMLLLSAPFSTAQAQGTDLFNNTNIYGVANGPQSLPQFSLSAPANIRQLVTYHWNFGQGSRPGTITLRHQSGLTFGPFAAIGTSGQGGAQNVNWIANVNVNVPPGNYTVFTSSHNTWSHNAQSRFQGFTIVRGSLLPSPPPQPPDKGGNNPTLATPVNYIAASIDSPSVGIINDQVGSADPNDWYSFTLNQPPFRYQRNVGITLNGVTANMNIQVFRLNGAGLIPVTFNQQRNGSTVVLNAVLDVYWSYPYKNTFLILVSSSNGITTPYQLSIQAR